MNKFLKEFQSELEQPKQNPEVKDDNNKQRQKSQIQSLEAEVEPTLSIVPKSDILPPSPCVTFIDISSDKEEGAKQSAMNQSNNRKRGKDPISTKK